MKSSRSLENFDQRKRFWEFLKNGAIQAPKELRGHLKVDERNFRFISGAAQAHIKDFFLYRALDEVQKSGISLLTWSQFIESPEDLAETNDQDQIHRITLESVMDEQNFRKRKLLEVLVELICYSSSDSEEYYRHNFLLNELNEYIANQKDRNDFYGFTSRNADYSIKFITGIIQSLESNGLDFTKCWYLQKQKPFSVTSPQKKIALTTFRERFKLAILLGNLNEKTVLGATYGHTYSNASRDIHFSPADSSWDFQSTDFIAELEHCGLLCHAIILRCQIFMGLIPDGWNKEIHAIHHDPGNKSAEILKGATFGDAEVGDFVFAEGDLGEIQEIRVAPIGGYRSILVNYISKRPIPEIDSDWFAPKQIQLILRKEKFFELLDKQVAEGKLEARFVADLRGLSAEALKKALRNHVVETFSKHARLK